MTDSSDIAQRTAARLRERFNAGETLIYSAAELLESLAAHISSSAAVARERNATIVLMTDTNRLQSEAIAMRDSTIADLRELLEFKRKEIANLRAGVAAENELHDILYRLGKAAAEARGVRFNGSIMGEDGVEQDIAECIAAKVRERKATTLSK